MKPTLPKLSNHSKPYVLEVCHLSKSIGGKKILRDISFTARRGEIIGILGKNGAGKTMLLSTLLGLIIPDGGSVRILGKDPRCALPWIRQRINAASSFQHLQLQASLTDNLVLFARLYQIKNADKKIDALLKRFRLWDLAKKNKKLYHLSSGENTRAMLCKAFLNDPEILFLDEPTAALDPIGKQQVIRFIKRFQNDRGMTVLFASHDLSEICSFCSRVLVLRRGAVTYWGNLPSRRTLIRRY